jgi:hypothetical protein
MGWDEQHHGCTSCWIHSANYEELQQHVEREHAPQTAADKGKQPAKHVHFDVGTNGHAELEDTGRYAVAREILDLSAAFKTLLKM